MMNDLQIVLQRYKKIYFADYNFAFSHTLILFRKTLNFVFILQGKIIFFKKSSIIQIISTKFANTNCSEVFTFNHL